MLKVGDSAPQFTLPSHSGAPLSLSDSKSSGRNAIEIGILCLALPVILVLGGLWLDYGARIQGSISAYYYTPMRDVYVALHGFIKKTRATPGDDLTLARSRQKELER